MVRVYPEVPYSEDDTLAHYGILGMKWGRRRYQNPDGTRTELGKRRERKGDGERGRKAKKAAKIAGGVAGTVVAAAAGKAAYDTARTTKIKPMPKNPIEWLKGLSDDERAYYFEENQKDGKDKPSVSRVEKTAKKAVKSARDVQKIGGKFTSKKAAREEYDRREKLRRQARGMSDDDLRQRINRMNLEKQYVDLSSYKSDTGRWTAQDRLDVGMDALEALVGIGSLAIGIHGLKHPRIPH